MTGFGLATEHFAWGSLIIELRAVNSRFLELHFKIPDQWRGAEPILRELLQQQLKRGKVECRLSSKSANNEAETTLSASELQRLGQWQAQIHQQFSDAKPLSVYEILKLRQLANSGSGAETSAQGQLSDEQTKALMTTAQTALDSLIQSRQREGASLASTLKQGLTQLRAIVEPLAEQMPALIAAQQQKFSDRLLAVFSNTTSPAVEVPQEEVMLRLRQEVGALGMRADVAEELARLNAHVVEFERCLDVAGPHGKRLDFLVQELNREANTIGSKSHSLISTHASLGLKQVIEQLREQIQNLE